MKLQEQKLTVDNLRKNRNIIIEKLIALFGEKNLKSAMEMLKTDAEISELSSEFKSIQDGIDFLIAADLFGGKDEKMHTADYLSTKNDSYTSAFSWNKPPKYITKHFK